MNTATGKSISLNGSRIVSLQLLLALMLAICGFSSVITIALSMLDIVPFPSLFSAIVIPSVLFVVITCLANAHLGKLAFKGWSAGIVAVLLYDVSRVPFILAGWDDFIPNIGVWLLQQEDVHPLVGYLYRYIGNGGGMGLSFLFIMQLLQIRINPLLCSTLYGIGIFCCLILTLLFTPLGPELMFILTPLTFTGSLLGHIIYGLVLGLVLRRMGEL